MIIRALTSDHDWTFGQGKSNYLSNNNAIAENIQTRLLSFLGDCFFDMQAGIDWISLLGTKNTKDEIVLSCKAVISNSYGVVRVNSVDIVATNDIRRAVITYNIDSIFSTSFTQSTGVSQSAG